MELKTRIELLTGNFQIEDHVQETNKVFVLEKLEKSEVVYEKITYIVDDTDLVPAYIIYPKHIDKKLPGILALHQTTTNLSTGAKEAAGLDGNDHYFYGLELAARGYVVIVPNYPFFGEYEITKDDIYKKYRYESVTMKGIMNHISAINILEALPFVNENQIGCIGHSLGGTNTIFVSYLDKRIKAAVISAGFTTFSAYAKSHESKSLSKWAQTDKYMPFTTLKFDNDPDLMPFDFPELLSSLFPIPLFLSTPIKDEVFDFEGAVQCVSNANEYYKQKSMTDKILHVTPNCSHDFPSNARYKSYNFLDKQLKSN